MVVSMKTSEILIAARDLIADPARWTQFSAARDAKNRPVEPFDLNAVCFCATGATSYIAEDQYVSADRLLGIAARDLFELDYAEDVNDNLGHAAVMQMYAKAIADARAEEART